MFFGHLGETETLRFLAQIGLLVRHSSVEKQDNEEATFMWIEAARGELHPTPSPTEQVEDLATALLWRAFTRLPSALPASVKAVIAKSMSAP